MFDKFAFDGLSNLGNKIMESSKNISKVEHNYNIIITSSTHIVVLLSSIYLSSVSISGINKMFIQTRKEDKSIPILFFLMNGSIIIGSSIMIVYSSFLL